MAQMWLHLLLSFLLTASAALVLAQNFTNTLPGYPGQLPFTLETGYVGVGDLDEVQLFYFFIESERNPVKDPLLLWLNGGPGCSAFSGLVYENIGPLNFDYAAFDGSLPSLLDNPYSWTQIASIIFVDAPVGTGFSYSTTQEGFYTDDTKSAEAVYQFLRKWLINHPKFLKNPLYITGDSYAGIIAPQVTLKVSNGNRDGVKPLMNLMGYVLGNPVTNIQKDQNSRIEFYHRLTLISSELYESITTSCNGEYYDAAPDNADCVEDIGLVAECTIKINDVQVLEPKCSSASPTPSDGTKREPHFFQELTDEIMIQSPKERPEKWCRGTIVDWKRCNKSLAYDYNLVTTVPYHGELIARGYRSLIYSGDHDGLIPYVGTIAWMATLNLTTVDGWRPWYVDGEVAGFSEKYANVVSEGLTFATVKGAGHTAPEYMPKQCLEMLDRWLSYYPL